MIFNKYEADRQYRLMLQTMSIDDLRDLWKTTVKKRRDIEAEVARRRSQEGGSDEEE